MVGWRSGGMGRRGRKFVERTWEDWEWDGAVFVDSGYWRTQ